MVRITQVILLSAILSAGVVVHSSITEDKFPKSSEKNSVPSINFVPRGNELENGDYIFYNKNPSIRLTGSIPRRYNQLNLADNLFLRLLPHCGCSRCKFYCGCCSQALLNALHIDTMICIKVEYLEKDIGFSYSVVVNDEVYVKKIVTVKDPPPVCFGIPTPLPRMRSSACITMYDIEVDGDQRTVHGCVKVSGILLNMFDSDYDLGCFDVNLKNQFFDNQIENETRLEKIVLDNDQMMLLQRLKEYKINETLLNANPFIEEKNNVRGVLNGTKSYVTEGEVNDPPISSAKNQTVSSNSSERTSIIDNVEYDDTLQQMRNLYPKVEGYDKTSPLTENDLDLNLFPFS